MMPDCDELETPAPHEYQWQQCPVCKRPMPANESAAYGAHEDCRLGVRFATTTGIERKVNNRMGNRVVRKATNQD